MCLTSSKEFNSIESWLIILVNTYRNSPSHALAQAINLYLGKLLSHDDIHNCSNKRCDYLTMQRFWQWHAMKEETKTLTTFDS